MIENTDIINLFFCFVSEDLEERVVLQKVQRSRNYQHPVFMNIYI
jgi:hypothetical protein